MSTKPQTQTQELTDKHKGKQRSRKQPQKHTCTSIPLLLHPPQSQFHIPAYPSHGDLLINSLPLYVRWDQTQRDRKTLQLSLTVLNEQR